jgi:hypothetical protein
MTGYARDPAAVAREAVKYGTENGFDCVLIDTAGRMQNNESLMRALAKLVSGNDPDLVLFVGEALVGNDGIDQLVMFDRVRSSCGMRTFTEQLSNDRLWGRYRRLRITRIAVILAASTASCSPSLTRLMTKVRRI